MLEPLASSYAVLHPDEKEVGVALIDIGGGTTDVAVFEDQTIRHTAVIAVAGNKVTDDIRKGLGVMRDQAERLKHLFGTALVDLADEGDIITIPGIGGRPEKDVSRSVLAQIIQPRMEEILEIAYTEIKRGAPRAAPGAGVVLTGGGALIPGTAELAADIMGMEARIGAPQGLNSGLVAEVSGSQVRHRRRARALRLRPEAIGAPAPQRRHGHARGRRRRRRADARRRGRQPARASSAASATGCGAGSTNSDRASYGRA